MNHLKTKGEITELFVAAELYKAGFAISIPYGENHRYDLVIEINGDLKKVQCKACRYYESSLTFDLCGQTITKGKTGGDYQGEIDFFATYCFETRKAYLMPITQVGKRSISLRITPPKNGNKHYKYAKDYEVSEIHS